MKLIDKLAWLYIKDRKVLVVRSKDKDVFYAPGGKREKDETDDQALIREIEEELEVRIKPETICHLETFEAQAHGKARGVNVVMRCHSADFEGELKPSSEIEEMEWFTTKDMNRTPEAGKIILQWLKDQDLID